MIAKTLHFLSDAFDRSEYFKAHPAEKAYRFEHSCRVANIGRRIAAGEGLNVQNLTIGCLLHDLSYCMTFKDREDTRNHGRYSAKLARPFLQELGLSAPDINEICYGIAIHVDDKADFDGERTPLACSIGEADNIDRFDAYRIYETLQMIKYDEMPLEDKAAHTQKVLKRLKALREEPFSTQTGLSMWLEKLSFQTEFYERLDAQIRSSSLEPGGIQ